MMKKINEGYCAELFEMEDNKLLKLYKHGWSETQVRHEYESTKSVNILGIPSPKVYHFVEQEQRFGFIMDKLNGITMLQMIQKTPFQAPLLAKQMAKLHYDIHCRLPGEAQIPLQKSAYAQAITNCSSLNEHEKNALIQLMDTFSPESKLRICHGDFHAMNILLSEDTIGVIDWAFATLGDPCADVAGSYMITRILAAASGGHNTIECFLFHLFTPVFANIYLKEYLKLSGRKRTDILKWIPIRAATYLDLGLPEQANRKLYSIAKRIGR